MKRRKKRDSALEALCDEATCSIEEWLDERPLERLQVEQTVGLDEEFTYRVYTKLLRRYHNGEDIVVTPAQVGACYVEALHLQRLTYGRVPAASIAFAHA